MATLRKYSLLVLAAVLAIGCMTPKKWAEGCAERFPVKESTVFVKGEIRYDTAYLAPDTLVFTDTVTVDCDTLKGVVTKYVTQARPCPPAIIRTITRTDTLKITAVDEAAVKAAELASEEQRRRADRITGSRNTWCGIAIVCLLLIGAAIFSKIKGFI